MNTTQNISAAIIQAKQAMARHESQNAGDPFRFELTDHRYVALRDLIYALSTPPADDVREALADLLMSDRVMNVDAAGRDYAYVEADAILAAFEVRPRGTVTDAARMEYTIAAESSNGAVFQIADYTTVSRDHLEADLHLFRQEEERLTGEPDRIFIAERPIPKWVRS